MAKCEKRSNLNQILSYSECFFQFYRTIILEFINWDWDQIEENIPRKALNKVYKILFPNGSGTLKPPHLADFILVPDSDWFIDENFVEFGLMWKNAHDDLVLTLNMLGILVPNFSDYTKSQGKKIITYILRPLGLDRKLPPGQNLVLSERTSKGRLYNVYDRGYLGLQH